MKTYNSPPIPSVTKLLRFNDKSKMAGMSRVGLVPCGGGERGERSVKGDNFHLELEHLDSCKLLSIQNEF